MTALVKSLNEAMGANKDAQLKAFFIFVSDEPAKLEPELAKLAEKTGANDVALAYVGSDDGALRAYKINLVPEVKNTVMLYRKKRVTHKFVNLKADEKGLAELKTAIGELTAAAQ